MSRKGQVRWVSGSDVRQQIQFINQLFELVVWDGAWSTQPSALMILSLRQSYLHQNHEGVLVQIGLSER